MEAAVQRPHRWPQTSLIACICACVHVCNFTCVAALFVVHTLQWKAFPVTRVVLSNLLPTDLLWPRFLWCSKSPLLQLHSFKMTRFEQNPGELLHSGGPVLGRYRSLSDDLSWLELGRNTQLLLSVMFKTSVSNPDFEPTRSAFPQKEAFTFILKDI